MIGKDVNRKIVLAALFVVLAGRQIELPGKIGSDQSVAGTIVNGQDGR